jgi:hypothetical protein
VRNIMENGSINPSEVATLSLLGGGGGYGYGGGNRGYNIGNQVLAAEAHANGTAVDAKVENIQDGQRLAFDSLQEQIRESRTLDQFTRLSDNQFRAEIRGSDQHADIVKGLADSEFRTAAGQTALAKDITDQEFRSLDRQRDITAMLVDNAKEAAKCCCETQKLIAAEAGETRALVLAVEGRTNVASLAAANAKITQLETINALHGHGRG